jgi:2-polyprenyl-3-methyl-5-hydroxy-6-metoxy-1,4-benzoquinol methylase
MEQFELDLNTSLYNKFGEKYCVERLSGAVLFNDYIEAPAIRSLIGNSLDIKGKNVLDIGCGPGIYTKMLTMAGANVTALDSSELMLNATRIYCDTVDNLISGSVKYINLRFEDADFGEKKFDLILATFMLGYFDDLTFVFKKMKAHLNKGGRIIASMLHPIRLFSDGCRDGKYIVSSYYSEGYYKADFLDKENPLNLKKYNFQDIFHALNSTGLRVSDLFEPKASISCGFPDIDKVKFYSENPSVLIISISAK